MDDIINEIAETIDEADEPERLNPMASAADGRHKDEGDEDDVVMHIGGEDPAHRETRRPSPGDPLPQDKTKEIYDEKSYGKRRLRAVYEINRELAKISDRSDFTPLLNTLMLQKVGGFEVLSYFNSELGIRATAETEESYVNRIADDVRLRNYTASPAVRRTAGEHPFRIRYNDRVLRNLGSIIGDITTRITELDVQIKTKKTHINKVHMARGATGKKLGHLSDKQVEERMRREQIVLNKQLKELESEIEDPRTKYDDLISNLASEYRSKIDNLKKGLVAVLPKRIQVALNKVWPKDYSDWLRTSKIAFSPPTADDINDLSQTSYSVRWVKGDEDKIGTIEVLPQAAAVAAIRSGEAELDKGPTVAAPENPSIADEPAKITASVEFSTLQNFDDDKTGRICKYCSTKCSECEGDGYIGAELCSKCEGSGYEGKIFHSYYDEYPSWNERLKEFKYRPEELVRFVYSLGGETKHVLIRRHEVQERDLLNQPEISSDIFPVDGGTINAINGKTNHIISLSIGQYHSLFTKQENLKGKTDLKPNDRVIASLILPTNHEKGRLSEIDIRQNDYTPVDKNGEERKEDLFTNLEGKEVPYSDSAYIASNYVLAALREEDFGVKEVWDSNTGNVQPWFDYNRKRDPYYRADREKEKLKLKLKKGEVRTTEGKLPDNALHMVLPPTPYSFEEAFGKPRETEILKVTYVNHILVVDFPWAVKGKPESEGDEGPIDFSKYASSVEEERDEWRLIIAKNFPIGEAILAARRMWDSHQLTDKSYEYKTPRGWWRGSGVEDPNNIRMTTFRGRDRELISVVRNFDKTKKDINRELQGFYCTADIKIGDKEKVCNARASHISYPEEVAMVTDTDTGKSTWKMVSREEAEARQEYINIQKGEESIYTSDQLRSVIDRGTGNREGGRSVSPITAHGSLCDTCWLNNWRIIPEGLLKAMLHDLEDMSKFSHQYINDAKEDEDKLGAAKKAILDDIDEFMRVYLDDGAFWEVIMEYVYKSDLSDNMKKHTLKTINRFNETLEKATYDLFDPSLNLINQTTVDPETGKPWITLNIDLVMKQVKNILFWLQTRMTKKTGRDALSSITNIDHYIIPFSRMTSPDVRSRNALSAALRDKGPDFSTHRSESLNRHNRVIIDGLLGEESYFNGLIGHVVGKKNGMCVVKLAPNDKTLAESIKVYPGEFSIIWEAIKPPSVDEYDNYVKETRSKERLKDDIIAAISDDTSESIYW